MVQAILSLSIRKVGYITIYFSLLRKRFLWAIPCTKYFLKLMSSLKVTQSKAETKIGSVWCQGVASDEHQFQIGKSNIKMIASAIGKLYAITGASTVT